MAQANNYFNVSGYIVRDPEVRLTTKQTKYSFVTIAVRGIGKDRTDFLSVCFWEKLADNMRQYCHKGDLVTVCGHISTFKREEKTEIQLVADGFTILHSNKKNSDSEPETKPEPKAAEPASTPNYGDVFAEMSEPFTPFT